MKSKRTWKTLLAAALSIAIAVVFMPVFGQVDKASADDGKIVAKIEIQQNDGHQLPLGSDPADLDSQKYENGQGDVLIVTYTDGTSTDYYCQDINWNFLSEAGKKIKVILDEWVDDPDSFVAGNDYEATAWVYSADEGTGVSKYDDLVNVSIKILAPLKKVTGVTLSLGKQIQLEENKEGKYNCIGDICCNEGDVAIAEYEDSSKVTFTCDANGNFRDDQNNDLPICFEWVDDGTATIDNTGSLTGEPGKTYSVYAYTFETVTQSVYGDEVYVVDEGGTKAVFPISIADHSWAADYTIDKEATCSEEGSKAIYCTVCGAKDETSVTTIPKAGHSWTVAYKWSSDNKSVTATATCRNNASHKETETVKTTSKVTKKATYTAMGQTTYTAKFTKPAFKTQTKVLTNVAKLVKKNQPMQVKTAVKKVKAKKLKKKAIKVSPITVTNPKGKVTYTIVKGKAKAKKALKLNKNTGKITVKKKTKKGTYKLKVKVTAAGTSAGAPQYKAGSKTVWITVKVK